MWQEAHWPANHADLLASELEDHSPSEAFNRHLGRKRRERHQE
jgi:hypothetical protein